MLTMRVVAFAKVENHVFRFSLSSAGNANISKYLLNYFPGLDIERRNCHGFTALMKAAMQGRAECVRALMLAGMCNLTR